MPSDGRLGHTHLGDAIERAVTIAVEDACEQHMTDVQAPLFRASLEDVRVVFRYVPPATSGDIWVSVVLDGNPYHRHFKHTASHFLRRKVLGTAP